MAVRFSFAFTGDKALEAQLAALPEKLELRILNVAIQKATRQVLLPPTIANTPVGRPYTRVTRGRTRTSGEGAFRQIRFRRETGGRLRRSYTVRQLRRRKGRVGTMIQAGKREALGIRGQGYYPAHQEFGWRHSGRGHRKSLRPIAGRQFMQRALLQHKAQWLQAVATEVRAGLEREVRP